CTEVWFLVRAEGWGLRRGHHALADRHAAFAGLGSIVSATGVVVVAARARLRLLSCPGLPLGGGVGLTSLRTSVQHAVHRGDRALDHQGERSAERRVGKAGE